MVFCSEDGFTCVNLSSEAGQTIEKEIQLHHPYETGGILIGKYDENLQLATVYLATGPAKDSEHKPTAFKRGVHGITDAIRYAQTCISPELHYIGEWHSHPNNSPNASNADLKQMQVFAKTQQLGISTPLLLIVGGVPPERLQWLFSLHRHKKPSLFLPLLR